MSEVFVVRDEQLGVTRALKILRPTESHQAEGRAERLRREARAMTALKHPNVLPFYDVGEDDGRTWYVMLLDAADNAMLADFGIALLNDAHRLTRTGVGIGSLAYMAPEQRIDARGVGATADLYAVGSMLYQLLTGGSPVDLFASEPDSDRFLRLPAELRPAVVKATRHRPEERYADARRMASALVAALEDLGGDARMSPGELRSVRRLDLGPTLERLGPDFVLLTTEDPPERSPVPAQAAAEPAPHPQEQAQLQELWDMAVLDTPAEERFERHTRMAQAVFGVPIALVSLVDQERQWFKSQRGLDASETPRDISFCGHAILDEERVLVFEPKRAPTLAALMGRTERELFTSSG